MLLTGVHSKARSGVSLNDGLIRNHVRSCPVKMASREGSLTEDQASDNQGYVVLQKCFLQLHLTSSYINNIGMIEDCSVPSN